VKERVSTVNWIYSGTCWKFGDSIAVDGDLMKLEFAISRETRPEILRDHVMGGIDPNFAKRVSPGDILVAGKRFAQGNPHIQGLIGIAGLQMGLVVESIPRGSLRNAINAGLPVLPNCVGVTGLCETGDRLRVDFCTGKFENITREITHQFAPLDGALLSIIAAGGWKGSVARRIAAMKTGGGNCYLILSKNSTE
jgi:3-isopropylmalate/(R)-2-methylmalate dehydratase small subunit